MTDKTRSEGDTIAAPSTNFVQVCACDLENPARDPNPHCPLHGTPQPTTLTVSGNFADEPRVVLHPEALQPAAPISESETPPPPKESVEKTVREQLAAIFRFLDYEPGDDEAGAAADAILDSFSRLRKENEALGLKVHRKQEKIHEQVETISALRAEVSRLHDEIGKAELRRLLTSWPR